MRRLGFLLLLGFAGCVLNAETVSGPQGEKGEPGGDTLWMAAADASISYSGGAIGVGTDSPRAKLDVNGGGAMIGNWGDVNPGDLPERTLLLGPRPVSPKYTTLGLQVSDTEKGTIQYDEKLGLSFGTFDDMWLTRMAINKNGNVGIGIDGPRATLDVNNGSAVIGKWRAVTPGDLEQRTLLLGPRPDSADIVNVGLQVSDTERGAIQYDAVNGMSFGTFDATWFTRMAINKNGNVGIGTLTPTAKLDVEGDLIVSGNIKGANFPDLAENILAAEVAIEAADVIAADPAGGERIVRASRPYDSSVLGVISTQPGILLNSRATDSESVGGKASRQRPLALAGRVPVKITLEGGPVRPGDPLTTSSVPGHAMRANEPWRGGTIGTALTGFDGKDEQGRPAATGKVIVFLALDRTASCNPETQDHLASRVGELEGKLAAEREARTGLEARLRALEAAFARPSGAARPSTSVLAPTR